MPRQSRPRHEALDHSGSLKPPRMDLLVPVQGEEKLRHAMTSERAEEARSGWSPDAPFGERHRNRSGGLQHSSVSAARDPDGHQVRCTVHGQLAGGRHLDGRTRGEGMAEEDGASERERRGGELPGAKAPGELRLGLSADLDAGQADAEGGPGDLVADDDDGTGDAVRPADDLVAQAEGGVRDSEASHRSGRDLPGAAGRPDRCGGGTRGQRQRRRGWLLDEDRYRDDDQYHERDNGGENPPQRTAAPR